MVGRPWRRRRCRCCRCRWRTSTCTELPGRCGQPMGTLPGGAASPGALSPTARPVHGHAPQWRRCAAGLGASSPAARPAQGRSSPTAQPAQGRSSRQRGQPSSRRSPHQQASTSAPPHAAAARCSSRPPHHRSSPPTGRPESPDRVFPTRGPLRCCLAQPWLCSEKEESPFAEKRCG